MNAVIVRLLRLAANANPVFVGRANRSGENHPHAGIAGIDRIEVGATPGILFERQRGANRSRGEWAVIVGDDDLRLCSSRIGYKVQRKQSRRCSEAHEGCRIGRHTLDVCKRGHPSRIDRERLRGNRANVHRARHGAGDDSGGELERSSGWLAGNTSAQQSRIRHFRQVL